MSYTAEQQCQITSLVIRTNHYRQSVDEWMKGKDAPTACSLRVSIDMLESIQQKMGFEIEDSERMQRWRERADRWIAENKEEYLSYLATS